jgi:pimeloyl-ACP methyl ester carboxylesterase
MAITSGFSRRALVSGSFFWATAAWARGWDRHIEQTALGPLEWGEWGSGPAVLSIHGTPGGFDTGLATGRLVGGGFRYLATSRSGYLGTPAPRGMPAGESLRREADLYIALLDKLHIERVPVLAYSGGGPFALTFATRYPERCRAVVLASGETQRDPETKAGHFWRRAGEELEAASDVVSWFPPLVAPHTAFSEVLRTVWPISRRLGGMVRDDDIFATLPDLELEKVRQPVLQVHGTSDHIVPFGHATAAAARLPHTELFPVKGGSHFSTIQRGSKAAARIVAFLREYAAK